MRKSPRQGRSIKLVEKILAEAARVIESEGFDALTTNELARRTGTSIGSIYQFFSGKDDIVRALAANYAEKMEGLFGKTFSADRLDEPLEALAAALLDEGQRLNLAHPGLKRLLLSEEAPDEARELLDAANRRISETVAAYMQARSEGRISRERAELCFFVTMSLMKSLAAATRDADFRAELVRREYLSIIAAYWRSFFS